MITRPPRHPGWKAPEAFRLRKLLPLQNCPPLRGKPECLPLLGALQKCYSSAAVRESVKDKGRQRNQPLTGYWGLPPRHKSSRRSDRKRKSKRKMERSDEQDRVDASVDGLPPKKARTSATLPTSTSCSADSPSCREEVPGITAMESLGYGPGGIGGREGATPPSSLDTMTNVSAAAGYRQSVLGKRELDELTSSAESSCSKRPKIVIRFRAPNAAPAKPAITPPEALSCGNVQPEATGGPPVQAPSLRGRKLKIIIGGKVICKTQELAPPSPCMTGGRESLGSEADSRALRGPGRPLSTPSI